ncbi:MAG: heavy-metal-associated domain-containing protein [Novosphingobium sp.]
MNTIASTLRPATSRISRHKAALLGVALGATLVAGFAARDVLVAQVAGERGIAPLATSTDIEIHGIKVDVTAKSAEEAREEGWKEAQRAAWARLGGPKISDSQLDSIVSAIVVDSEQIGYRRYIATLGVIFDRSRASQFMGGDGERSRSAPMLLVPVLNSGGVHTVYEIRNAWQRTWAEYQPGGSAIDYVRPSGAGADSLLLTFGQEGRRSRTWWRNILDDFGAADVIFAIAHLERQWPGGPIKGTFTARYGPDNRLISSFTMTAQDDEALPAMLEKARNRLNTVFTGALRDGLLKPDPTLALDSVDIAPAIQALLEQARKAETQNGGDSATAVTMPDSTTVIPQVVTSFTVQFATPDAGAVDSALASVRGTAGVRGAATTSIALGGTSIMSVSYAGDIDGLAAALRARGWQVAQGGSVLRISR